MKQAPGVDRIEYKVLGSATIHPIPAVKDKSSVDADTEKIKGSDTAKVKMVFRVVENDINKTFLASFLNNIRQHLLFRCYFKSGKVSTIGNEEYMPIIKLQQKPGEKAGDFVGYIFEVTWSHPLFM
jgi:hypothetical protein